jgi:hypothetical protein
MRIAALCVYAFFLLASSYWFLLYQEANAHLPWIWRLDTLAQSFIGLVLFAGFALYVQARTKSVYVLLIVQFVIVGLLCVGSVLSHAFPQDSIMLGGAHFAAIAIFVGWDLWRLSREPKSRGTV